MRIIVVVTTGMITCFVPLLPSQDTTASQRFEIRNAELVEEVHVDLGSIREAFSRIMHSAGRAGGIVEVTGCGEANRHSLHLPAGGSLEGALDLLTAAASESYWTIQDGVIDLLPRRSHPPILEVRLRRVEWDTTATVEASFDRVFHQEAVRAALVRLGVAEEPRGQSWLQAPPRVIDGIPRANRRGKKFEIENVTLFFALNAIARSYISGFWWYRERTCGGKSTYWFSGGALRRPE